MYGKDVRTEEVPITSITIWMCDFKEYSRDTGRFWQMSFLYAKIYKRTGRDKFSVSVYREKQDEEWGKQREDFYKMKNYEDKIYSLGETVTG